MKRTAAALGALFVAGTVQTPALADEAVFRTIPTPRYSGVGLTDLVAPGRPGEVWATGSENFACVTVPTPIGTTDVCTWDATVKQWTGGTWVDRRPPSRWKTHVLSAEASAPTNFWIAGRRLDTPYYARWDGSRWHLALFPPACGDDGIPVVKPVGSGDEAWVHFTSGFSGRPCVLHYKNGTWKAHPEFGDVENLELGAPGEVWLQIDGDHDPDRLRRWDGTTLTEVPYPAGAYALAAADADAVYVRTDEGLIRMASGTTTEIIAPALDYFNRYELDADGTLFCFGLNDDIWRWTGTEWTAVRRIGSPINSPVLSRQAPGEIWYTSGPERKISTDAP